MEYFRKKYLKSSSLHESVISISLLSLAISLSLLIFSRLVNDDDFILEKSAVQGKIQSLRISIEKEKKNYEAHKVFFFRNYEIHQNLNLNENIYHLNYTVKKGNNIYLKKTFLLRKE